MQRFKYYLPLILAACFASQRALACATCYGESDSNLAVGMNWGILSLMVVAYFVLFSIAGFFGYLMYRSHRMASAMEAESASETDEQ